MAGDAHSTWHSSHLLSDRESDCLRRNETTFNKLNNVALAGADYALRIATVIVDWF